MTRTLKLIIAALAFQMASRGLDYLLGDPRSGTGVFELDSIGPAFAWGIACVIAALIVAAGLVTRRDNIVRAGALLASSIYIAFALMVMDNVYVDGTFDDWRYLTLYLSIAFIWGVIAWALTVRMAVTKNRKEHSAD